MNSILVCFIEKHPLDRMPVEMLKHARRSSLIPLLQLNLDKGVHIWIVTPFKTNKLLTKIVGLGVNVQNFNVILLRTLVESYPAAANVA